MGEVLEATLPQAFQLLENTVIQTGLETIIPDNSRFSINMHYQSEATMEYATFHLTKSMTIDEVLSQYAAKCPIECQTFLGEVKKANEQLHRSGGMSNEGVMMALGRIPNILLMMIEFVQPHYFEGAVEGRKNFIRFIRSYPKFAIGDHSLKSTTGVIVK